MFESQKDDAFSADKTVEKDPFLSTSSGFFSLV